MNTEQFNDLVRTRGYVEAGSEAHLHMHEAAARARKITAEINGSYRTMPQLRALFSQLIGQEVDENFGLFPPFYTDYGANIKLGRNVFINSCCCFQDQGGIEIGDNVQIGHQTVIATLNHDLDPDRRRNMEAAPVRIGNNVWIGSHSTILAGVSIGDNSVVAAGAVVTKDVPAGVVVAGVPAKIVKEIGR